MARPRRGMPDLSYIFISDKQVIQQTALGAAAKKKKTQVKTQKIGGATGAQVGHTPSA